MQEVINMYNGFPGALIEVATMNTVKEKLNNQLGETWQREICTCRWKERDCPSGLLPFQNVTFTL